MSQIIKITESQLKNIVGRVLNKQLGLSPATTNNNATSVLNEADDIDTIVKNIESVSLSSENEKTVVNTIIKNSKTKQGFENLLSQFKSKTGKDLASELSRLLQPTRDPNEISQLKTHLSGIGITLNNVSKNNRFAGFSFGGVAAPATPGAMNPLGGLNQFTQQKPLNIGCIGLKSPETNKTITGISGETFKFFNNGRFIDTKGQKGNYVCGNQANIVNLMFDSDPKAIKYFNMAPQPAAQQQTKPVFVANEKFPLKLQQKGELIKKLQTALGVKPTGQFWTVTEKAVLAKAPEYKRETGVTQEIYNKIVSNPSVKRILDTSTVPLASRPLPSMTVDTSKLAQLPNIQGIQSNVSAERRQEIASKIEKQPVTGRLIYKGGDLNPEEQQFLNTYVQALGGGELGKSKDKGYGQKMVYNN
jgi:hypothetical protein